MKAASLLIALAFVLAGTAWEGPACASIKGKPTCCASCPFKRLPKVGNSCCSQGAEKGAFLAAEMKNSSSPIAFSSLAVKAPFRGSLLDKPIASVTLEGTGFYLLEEHLLL